MTDRPWRIRAVQPRPLRTKRRFSVGLSYAFAFVLMMIAMPLYAGRPAPGGPSVVQIDLHDTLQPIRARLVVRQIDEANHRPGVRAIVINLSTPGGLPESAEMIVNAIQTSRLPVIVWTGQPDTRVSGEGLRLLAAADLAFMNPDTFLSPLWSDRPRGLSLDTRITGSQHLLTKLQESFAAHGRDLSSIDELASGIHWFSAREAMQAGIVDGVAYGLVDVLHMSQGRTIRRNGAATQLELPENRVEYSRTGVGQRLLLSLMNPDLTVLLLTLGLLLIYLEVNTPGTVVPGAAGVLLVLLSFYALQMLPLSMLGLFLCALAVALLLLEARLASHGILAAAGTLVLVGGLKMLVMAPLPQMQVNWGTAVGSGLGFGGVTACLIVLGMEARRAKVKTGSEAMLGWLAVAQTPLAPEGHILVRGELWKARLTSHDSYLAAGERVKVIRAEGLTLEVTAVPL
jgi:membrane-bound serine protease (ClpP class)